MSKHIQTRSGANGTTVKVSGKPVAVTGYGNQFTVVFEDNPSTSYDVQSFRPGSPIPDTATYLGTIGTDANASYIYVL